MHWNNFSVQSATFVAVSAATYLIFRTIWLIDRRVRDRLVDLSDQRSALLRTAIPRAANRGSASVRSRLARAAANLLPNDEHEQTQLRARLIHAGIYAPWAPGLFLTVKLLLIL